MSSEKPKHPASEQMELLYLPPSPTRSEKDEKATPPRSSYTFGYVPAKKPRDLKSVKEFFVGNPYFFVPLAGLGGVLFSLITAVSRFAEKAMAPEGTQQRFILDKRFMQRMDLVVKCKVFTFATGTACYLYYELYLKKSRLHLSRRKKSEAIDS